MEVRLESDWSRGLVPKEIASVLVGFRTRPLWMNQLWKEETYRWRLQRLLDKDERERKTKSKPGSFFSRFPAIDMCPLTLVSWLLVDWMTALRRISTERLFRQETLLNKIWSRFVDKYNCIWRKADWPASWHISTKSYQWQWKCRCNLTSCSGHHSVWMQFNVMPRTKTIINKVRFGRNHPNHA